MKTLAKNVLTLVAPLILANTAFGKTIINCGGNTEAYGPSCIYRYDEITQKFKVICRSEYEEYVRKCTVETVENASSCEPVEVETGLCEKPEGNTKDCAIPKTIQVCVIKQ